MNPNQPSPLPQPCTSPVCLGAVIAGTYHLTGFIHIGPSYTVYIAKDLRSNIEYAAKVGSMESRTSLLHKENEIYRAMHSRATLIGIPTIRCFHNQGNYATLIMDRFGKPLQDPSSRNLTLLPLPLTLRVGMDVTRILARVHKHGFLHLDISPTNILFDDTDHPLIVRLVDFGCAERFLSCGSRKHRHFGQDSNATGTIRFASVCTHAQLKRSRVDDLESLLYVLIFVHRGTLPWDVCINTETEGNAALEQGLDPGVHFRNALFDKVGLVKSNISVRDLCVGMPPEVAEYFRYVQDLQYRGMPDYVYLIKLLEAALKRTLN